MKTFLPLTKISALSLVALFIAAIVKAQTTYNTIAAGNWSSTSTWSGGVVPPYNLPVNSTVNITKKVTYDLNYDLNISGNLKISGDTLKFNTRNITISSTGILKITNGGLVEDLSSSSGNLTISGGILSVTNSRLIISNNIIAQAGTRRNYTNSYIQSGGNYNTNASGSSGVTDTVQSSIIKAWPLNGSAVNIQFNNQTTVLTSHAQFYCSGDLQVKSQAQMITLGSPTYAIDTMNIGNNLDNQGTWVATINAYCVGGSVQGNNASAIDFTKPSICSNPTEIVLTNPVLIAGTDKQDGATYKFSNVSYGLDATIQITKRSGANVIVHSIDVTNAGWAKAFQPQVGVAGGIPANTAAWMEFNVKFYRAGTNQLAKIQKFYVTALDVDGDNSSIAEFVQFEKADSVQYSAASLLNNASPLATNNEGLITDLVNAPGNLLGTDVRSQGPIANGVNIDTANVGYMATYTYINKNNFKFIVGAKNGNAPFTNVGPALLPATPVPGAAIVDPNSTTLMSTDAGLRLNSIWFKAFNMSQSILPVKLIAFTAQYNKTDVTLKWKTADEKNLRQFIVEYSTNGSDFSTAGIVYSNGNNNGAEYSYIDRSIAEKGGNIYYRLKMMDDNGKFTYSPVRMVHLGQEVNPILISTYPNPAVNNVKVTMPAGWQNKTVVIDIYNANGYKVKNRVISHPQLTETMTISDLEKGVYILKAICGTETAQQTIIKTNYPVQ